MNIFEKLVEASFQAIESDDYLRTLVILLCIFSVFSIGAFFGV